MPEENRPAAVIGKEEARQGRPQGFVRNIMLISIALALIGMFIAYLVIKP
jgi:Sec-independent protein secretion pathway component TatC